MLQIKMQITQINFSFCYFSYLTLLLLDVTEILNTVSSLWPKVLKFTKTLLFFQSRLVFLPLGFWRLKSPQLTISTKYECLQAHCSLLGWHKINRLLLCAKLSISLKDETKLTNLSSEPTISFKAETKLTTVTIYFLSCLRRNQTGWMIRREWFELVTSRRKVSLPLYC